MKKSGRLLLASMIVSFQSYAVPNLFNFEINLVPDVAQYFKVPSRHIINVVCTVNTKGKQEVVIQSMKDQMVVNDHVINEKESFSVLVEDNHSLNFTTAPYGEASILNKGSEVVNLKCQRIFATV